MFIEVTTHRGEITLVNSDHIIKVTAPKQGHTMCSILTSEWESDDSGASNISIVAMSPTYEEIKSALMFIGRE